MLDRLFNRRGCLACTGASAALILTHPALAAAKNADALVREEQSKAKAEGKTLALYFFASWCPYCRLFDIFLNDPEAAPIFNTYFHLLRLRIRERDADHKAMQVPGTDKLFWRYFNAEPGLPMFIFLDKDSKVLSTSMAEERKANIGFPVDDWELNWFETMLARAAPSMPARDIAALRKICVRIYKG